MPNYITSIPITEDRLPSLCDVIDRLEAMGYRVTRHGVYQARTQCPAHGGDGLNLSIRETDRGVRFKCWSQGCSPRAIWDALGLGGPAPKPRASPQIRPPDTGRQRANAGDLDRIHRALLARLPLSPEHRQNLRERGLNDDQISSGCYRTFAIEGRPQMARDLIDQFGEQLCASVPGFVRKEAEDRRWWTLAGSAGLLIPVRDIEHRIRALKIRADGDSRGPRYSWMSSVRYGGPSPGAPPHVPIYTTPGRVVRVSEGELKGDIATCLSGLLTLGIAGVSQWRSAIPLLEQFRPETVSLAWDADRRHNSQVAKTLGDAALELSRLGYDVQIESWEPELGKGIDDLLRAGHQPERQPWAAASPLDRAPPTRPASPTPDRDVLMRMLACAAGPRIRRLWRGDTTGYGSASAAARALLSHLMWWCNGDRAQADRLFRMSRLCRGNATVPITANVPSKQPWSNHNVYS